MKALFKKGTALIVLFVTSVFLLFAEKTSVEHLYSYQLDNGLSVFVAENHSAPLVYIEVAVRTGAVAQTPENAGLFHLYEHMMFKGNKKYPTSQQMQRALNDMGCAKWNGTTGIDHVNYFVTVPVDQFEKGLEFWSYAIREPLMNPKEFEDEKKVVISEIQGYFAQPSEKSFQYTSKLLFSEAPWTRDPCGSVEVIQGATVEQLKSIQKKYYIPNNAAVFVGGDVNPDEACRLVEKIYGSWKSGEDPWTEEAKPYAANPLSAPSYCVLPNDEVSSEIAQVSISYHGPDSDFNLKDTYTGDVISKVLDDPSGAYKKTLIKNKKLKIPDSTYIWSGYQTSRHHGILSFNAIMTEPAQNLPSRAKDFLETVTKKALPAVQNDKSLETESKRKQLVKALEDEWIWNSESAEKLLSNLSYFWTYATRDYFFTYGENMKKVEKKDIAPFFENYVYDRNPVIMVFVNPAVYEQTKQEFKKAGFVEVSAGNAFWWNKE